MRTVGVKLIADVAGYMSGIARAGAATKDFAGQLDQAAKHGALDQVADRAAVAGLGLVGLAGTAVKLSMDFEKSMSAVGAATHASAGEIDQLREAALAAGKDTQYSATGAANAITELSKAGVATADVLNGGLKGALSLAAAGQLDVGEAAETAASAMTQFKLKGKDIPHIADLLAAAAGKAQGTVHDMGMALNQAGLVAAQTGLSIEDTTGTLAAFASAGLTGSDAGTSFKQMLLMLQAPSKSTKKLMDELGISAYDAQGQFVGITALAQQLRDKLGKLTPEMRANAMATIFGADATRAASIVYENGAAGIQGWIDKTNDAGYAAETAAKLTDNLAGDLERLKGSLETLAIESGGGANSGLRVLAQSAEKLVDAIGELPSGVTATATVMAGLGGTLLLGAAAWVKTRQVVANTAEELRNVGPAGERAARGLERGSKMAGKAALAFGALQAISMGVAALTETSYSVDRLTKSLQDYAATGKAVGEMKAAFGENADGLAKTIQYANDANHGFWKFFNGVQSGIPIVNSFSDSLSEGLFGESFNSATAKTEALDDALAAYMGQVGSATQANELWSQVLLESASDATTLMKLLPNTTQKMTELNAATSGVADATGKIPGPTDAATAATKEYKTAADAAAAAANGQREALTQLSDKLKEEADPVFGLLNAQKKLATAQREAAEATRKHGANSEEAREKTQDLTMAAIDLEGQVGALGSTFNGELSPAMRQTLQAAHLTEGQIAAVERQFRDAKRAGDAYADNYAANTSAPGAKAAKTDLDKARAAALAFDGRYGAALSVTGFESAKAKLQTLINYQNTLKRGVSVSAKNLSKDNADFLKYADGGPVYGPGTATSDSIAARLSNGEHVWTAREVQAAGGHGAVESIRSAVLTGPARFADGGSVDRPGSTTIRIMPAATAGTTTTVVHEHRVTFGGAQGDLGSLFLKAIRTSPGVAAEAKKLLGVR